MQPNKTNKFEELCDGYDEIFALLYNDPEGGPEGLKALLKQTDLAREDLEDAALALKDAGMHRASKIVATFAAGQPSECDRDINPWPAGSVNARHWDACLPARQQSRRCSREEQRRRKRTGAW